MALTNLPKTLVAHTPAAAADVMADLNALLKTINGEIDGENLAASIGQGLVPAGTLLMSARTTAPAGYLLCQGQAVSRTAYATLFAAIGTNFGAGDGATTFNVPDFRGRVPVGPDAGAGRLTIASTALGAAGGEQHLQFHTHEIHMNTADANPNHNHKLFGFGSERHEGSGFGYENQNSTPGEETGSTQYQDVIHHHAIDGNTYAAGEGGSQNIQPFLTVNYLIKT